MTKKEIGVKGVIENHDDINIIMQEINLLYKDVYGKYPERFSLDSKD
ncbi:MAG: hypothetical protein Q7J06_11570 [Bacteroidales bacterium]|nr:hypothetical protein [Bacteroidales bacterium]